MKKTKTTPKRLLLKVETVRELKQPTDDELRHVAGGEVAGRCSWTHTSFGGSCD